MFTISRSKGHQMILRKHDHTIINLVRLEYDVQFVQKIMLETGNAQNLLHTILMSRKHFRFGMSL